MPIGHCRKRPYKRHVMNPNIWRYSATVWQRNCQCLWSSSCWPCKTYRGTDRTPAINIAATRQPTDGSMPNKLLGLEEEFQGWPLFGPLLLPHLRNNLSEDLLAKIMDKLLITNGLRDILNMLKTQVLEVFPVMFRRAELFTIKGGGTFIKRMSKHVDKCEMGMVLMLVEVKILFSYIGNIYGKKNLWESRQYVHQDTYREHNSSYSIVTGWGTSEPTA